MEGRWNLISKLLVRERGLETFILTEKNTRQRQKGDVKEQKGKTLKQFENVMLDICNRGLQVLFWGGLGIERYVFKCVGVSFLRINISFRSRSETRTVLPSSAMFITCLL